MATPAHPYIFYGIEADADELQRFAEHLLRANLVGEQQGRKKTPICIWGTHGIGKTELVEALAAENGYAFAYIAPAQFEEMGDLIGMPAIVDGVTVFRPPSWVPTQEGPGLLLIDDVNRADDRILRGIMQLLQNFELVSWRLPPRWQIVLTANPDGGDYAVTPMDDAMLTRMMHVTMRFEAKNWARWAEKAGVDPRGINFVLTYPEIAQGKRTTPRSLVQFFTSIQGIKDLREELPLVQMLAASCLDEETVAAFVAYVQQNLSELMAPVAICSAKDFHREVYQPIQALVQQAVFRVDIMATICTRLINFLAVNKQPLTTAAVKNIQEFIKIDFLPNDLRLAFLQDLVQLPNATLKGVLADAAVSKMLLERM
jgi:MoxR-like ATPase